MRKKKKFVYAFKFCYLVTHFFLLNHAILLYRVFAWTLQMNWLQFHLAKTWHLNIQQLCLKWKWKMGLFFAAKTSYQWIRHFSWKGKRKSLHLNQQKMLSLAQSKHRNINSITSHKHAICIHTMFLHQEWKMYLNSKLAFLFCYYFNNDHVFILKYLNAFAHEKNEINE